MNNFPIEKIYGLELYMGFFILYFQQKGKKGLKVKIRKRYNFMK